GAWPISPLCFPRLPMGAPHRYFPETQGAGERDLPVSCVAQHGARWLDLRQVRGLHGRWLEWQKQAFRDLFTRQPALLRPRECSSLVGQEAKDDREQRVGGNYSHVQFGFR